MNVKNIGIVGAVAVFGACTTAFLMHHAIKMEEDFEEMKKILENIDAATNIEEVTALMHRATELFGRHNSVKEFYDLDAEVMDRGTKKACEILDEYKKEKEA